MSPAVRQHVEIHKYGDGALHHVAAVYTHPAGHRWRAGLMSYGAAILGNPSVACPGYDRVGLAFRVPGGWWRIKGQAVKS